MHEELVLEALVRPLSRVRARRCETEGARLHQPGCAHERAHELPCGAHELARASFTGITSSHRTTSTAYMPGAHDLAERSMGASEGEREPAERAL